jgi:hypothetical protein
MRRYFCASVIPAFYQDVVGGKGKAHFIIAPFCIEELAPGKHSLFCDGLGFLGIELQEKRNAANEGVISTAVSRVAVRVIRTDEERMIAKTVCRVLGLGLKEEN